MFTLYYFIIIKVARSVGLRICAFLLSRWECPCAKSRLDERDVRRVTALTYTCSERTVMPQLRYAELTPRLGRQAEDVFDIKKYPVFVWVFEKYPLYMYI